MGADKPNRSSSLFHPDYPRLIRMLYEIRDGKLTQVVLGTKMKRHRTFVGKVESGERRIDLIEFTQWCKLCGEDPVKVFAKWYR